MTAPPDVLGPLIRSAAFTRLLERRGIHPRQYRVLVDLYETLGARQELVGLGEYGAVQAISAI